MELSERRGTATAGLAMYRYSGTPPDRSRLPFLMSFATQPGMQGEAVDVGDAFHSGLAPVQWADAADHKDLAPLLRSHGDSVGDGTVRLIASSPS